MPGILSNTEFSAVMVVAATAPQRRAPTKAAPTATAAVTAATMKTAAAQQQEQ